MKLLLTILLFLSLKSFGTVYYITSTGSDGDGKTQATAWKTIAKLNANWGIIKAGDQILFKKGETFSGTITPSVSGIYIGAFGTGAKPQISNLTTISGWVNSGSGIWTSTGNASLPTSLNVVFLNGSLQAIGRYPNLSATNKGYLKFEGATSTTITDNELPASPNWTGADVVIRSRNWVLDRKTVISHSTNVITVASSQYTPNINYGYFFENDIKTLDQFGEWCYNATAKTVTKLDGTTTTVPGKSISIYFGASGPGTNVIQATTSSESGISLATANLNNITIDGLSINGQNDAGIIMTFGKSNIRIINCDINATGRIAVDAYKGGINNCAVKNCVITNSYSNGILFTGERDTISDNTIDKIYAVAGMGGSGDGEGFGTINYGSGNVIERNKVSRIGYIGISFTPTSGGSGSNNSIKNNWVDSFCYTKDDGGGIYSYNSASTKTPIEVDGNVVDGNFVSNSIGVWEGTSGTRSSAEGIYFDGKSRGITAINNTVWNISNHGLFFNNTRRIVVRNNTFYNCWNTVYIRSYDSVTTNSSMNKSNVLAGNIAMSLASATSNSQAKIVYYTSKFRDIQNWGKIDSNYYDQPLNEPAGSTTSSGGVIRATYEPLNSNLWYSLDKWQAATLWNNSTRLNYDLATKKTPKTITNASDIRFEFNPTGTNKTVTLSPNTYIDVASNPFKTGSLVLQPYTSKLLIITTGVPVDTTGNNPPATIITNPVDNAVYSGPVNLTITASATDDGSISKVEFYNGSALLGSDNTSPYSFAWNNLAAGKYSITAKATDNTGLSTVSDAVTFTVNAPNNAPTIKLTSPVDGAKFIAPATVTISTDATDTDGYIDSVMYYKDGVLIHTESTLPFTWDWTNVAAGSYKITAKAVDNKGASTTSTAANISVRALVAPNVSITSPTDNTNFSAPATINISASAIDPDGIVKKVEFYNNGALINTDTTSPYSYSLTNVAKGNYSLTAKAYDNDGQVTTSSAVAIFVNNKQSPIINITSPLTGAIYNDPAEVSITASASDPDGVIKRVDFYRDTILIGSDITAPFSIVWSSAMAGHYSLTAKAVDNDTLSTTSAAVGITINHTNIAPAIDIIEPGDTTLVGEQTRFTAVANDVDGKVVKVEFYNGSTLIGTVTNAPYSIDLSLAAGTYTLVAKATDNSGATTQKTVTKTVREPILTDPIIIKGHKAILQ